MKNKSVYHIALAMALNAIVLPALAAATGPGMSYVTNQEDAVSVIDLATLEVTRTLEIGARGPRGIGLTDDGAWLVTANMYDGNISVLDTKTGSLVRQVSIGKNPEFVRVVGQTAYVTFEPSSQSRGGPGPGEGNADREDDAKIPGHIAVVDLKSGKIVQDIVGKPETEGLEFSRDGSRMVVTNESDNSLGVYNMSTGELINTVSVAQYGNRPRGIKLSPDGSTYLVTLERSDKLLVFNERLELIKALPTGKAPYGVAFNRRGDRAFVAANRDKALEVFDAKTWEKIKVIPTGDRCWHFSFTPDDSRILLACGKSNEVVVVDVDRLQVIKRIANLKTPWGIVSFPKSMGSID